jgi:hypothetical protein
MGKVEDGEELRVPGERRIRPQGGSNLLGLVLKDGGARRFERVVVLKRELDGLLQRDAHGRGSRRRRLLRESGADGEEKQDPPRWHRSAHHDCGVCERTGSCVGTATFTVVALQSLISYKRKPNLRPLIFFCLRKKIIRARWRLGGRGARVALGHQCFPVAGALMNCDVPLGVNRR